MTDVKYGEIYLSKYLYRQRNLKKFFNVLTLLVSVSGIFSWKYFEDYVWIVFLFIAAMQLFTLVENEIIRSNKEVEDLVSFKMDYTKYFNQLEKLWTQYHYQQISETTAINHYFKLKTKYGEKIEAIDSQINIRRYKRMMKKTDEEMKHYFNIYHNYV